MNIRSILKIYVLVMTCFLMTSQFVLAEGIKERMMKRLPVIADLKAKGIIGEDNRGYLGFVTGTRASEDVIAAENRDRKAIYSHFAKQQNTTLTVVEKIQAKRKAQKAEPGEFYQNPDGAWLRK